MEIREHAEITPELFGSGYKRMCGMANLSPIPGGYGLLHCVDDAGQHWTKLTDDIEFHHVLVAQLKSGNGRLVPFAPRALAPLADVVRQKYTKTRAGWPDEWNQ